VRVAVVSDIHGNRTAFEAVLADLRLTAPDLILHGGDLADAGSGPVEIVDRIRDLGWPGVMGNTDEMLARPESLTEFASRLATPALRSLFEAVAEMAAVTRELLGPDRLAWLGRLPRTYTEGEMALVHASLESVWGSPGADAADADLESAYVKLGQQVAVYGHIHRPYVRRIGALTVANSGSVGMPYDGDRRASYLLMDDGEPAIRRVEYDVDREVKALRAARVPHAEWVVKTLLSAGPQMP
jgi:predicted phosphodiesterase